MFIEINDDIEIIDIMSDRVSFFCNQVLTEKVIDKIINIVDHLPENLDVFIYVPSKFVKYTENYSRILFIKEYLLSQSPHKETASASVTSSLWGVFIPEKRRKITRAT